MTKRIQLLRLLPALLIAALLLFGLSVYAAAPTADVTFTFSDAGITVSDDSAGGYEIDGTQLTITAAGTYAVTGSCADGSITVKKGVTDVTLLLEDLTLSSTSGAPLRCNKTSAVTLWLSGSSTLTDAENPADEDSTDEAIADAFDGAAIKVKSGAALTITGDGSLTVDGADCKNGVKGAATATITLQSGTVTISAAKNGLACDGAVIIKGGTLDITAGNDAIKAEPDDDDAESAGTVTISGGTLKLRADGDGVQATGDLTITGGTFEITTFNGATFAKNLGDDSAKGLKSDANTIISGGTFTLDCADDAIHANGKVTITGGTFTIDSGDDAIHADDALTIGERGASAGPEITVKSCYEGFEGGTVTLNAGKGSILASDDGVNAASDEANYEMVITINGGEWYIDAAGDGLDAGGDSQNNRGGDIVVNGGGTEVYGAANSGNSALDFDGSMTYNGGTLLAIGMNGMAQTPTTGTYVVFGQSGAGGGFFGGMFGGNSGTSVSVSMGSQITIQDASGTALYTAKATKSANHIVFMSDALTEGSTYTLLVNGSAKATATAESGNGQGGQQPGQGGQQPGQGGQQPGQGGQQPGQGGQQPGQGGQQPPQDDQQTTGLPFTDVRADEWYYDAVCYAYENGIINGYGNGLFGPNDDLTRAQMVQLLYNLEGRPTAGKASFSDVESGSWYADAVAWAEANEIVNGYDDGTFGPDDTLTRAQAAAILMRYAQYQGVSTTERAALTAPDAASIPDWAANAMQWCVAKGLLQGDSSGNLLPNGTANRGQIAAILQRYLTAA